MPLSCKTKINAPNMYEVPDKDMMKIEIMPLSSVANMAQSQNANPARVFSIHSLQVERIFPGTHNEKKYSALLYVSYVLMSTWTYLCQSMKDERFR